MENPVEEIESVIYKLTQGSPRLQQQTLEKYFTPNASFLHPFCAVHDNRNHILSIFRWYKVLSPRIDIQVNGISYEEARQKLYVDISQTFRIWPLVPLGYRADVNLVTVLQLTRDPSGRDPSAQLTPSSTNGAKPFNAFTAAPDGETSSPFTPGGTEKPPTALPPTTEQPKYWILSQNDLYQVPEFAKFASLIGLLPMLVSLWHAFATLCCILGAIIFAPFSAMLQKTSDRAVEHRTRVRRDGAFGPSLGGSEGEKERRRALDVWEAEARFLGGSSVGDADVGKMEGLKMKMEGMGSGGGEDGGKPVMEWMKMEKSAGSAGKDGGAWW